MNKKNVVEVQKLDDAFLSESEFTGLLNFHNSVNFANSVNPDADKNSDSSC